MIALIEAARISRYGAAMRRMVLRLLALVALILMPFGVPGSAAMAQASAVAESGHCGDHGSPREAPQKAHLHCNGCSAVAALQAPEPVPELMVLAPALVTAMRAISGIEPEIATPPPKFS